MSERAKTPETDAQTPDERTIERLVRERDEALAQHACCKVWADDARKERDEAQAESKRLLAICTNTHDRLLRGDDDTVLLAMLSESWKARKAGKGEGH